MASPLDTAEGSGESEVEAWLREKKLSALLHNPNFMEYIKMREVEVVDILALSDQDVELSD